MNKRTIIFLSAIMAFAGMGCRKTNFASLPNPAYLRVFNCLSYNITLDNKDAPQPFLTMLVNPILDAGGIPESAQITGDFLDLRDDWARPYPDAANTSVYQKEYPGTAKILAAPILNGYDLSSWAQVPSGKLRVQFYSRPLSTTDFFSLEKNQRKLLLIDTTIELKAGEVYTMHVLEEDYTSRKKGIYLRNETFVKQSFSDSLVYVNFYNLSEKGFYENTPVLVGGVDLRTRIQDTVNVFCSLNKSADGKISVGIPGFSGLPMGSLVRSLEPAVTSYQSFPLFADTTSGSAYTGLVSQVFTFLAPGFTPANIGYTPFLPEGVYLALAVGPYGNVQDDVQARVMADIRSGLIVSERSGIYNPRSFATVNTIEYINGKIFVTTIQRKFDPPIY